MVVAAGLRLGERESQERRWTEDVDQGARRGGQQHLLETCPLGIADMDG